MKKWNTENMNKKRMISWHKKIIKQMCVWLSQTLCLNKLRSAAAAARHLPRRARRAATAVRNNSSWADESTNAENRVTKQRIFNSCVAKLRPQQLLCKRWRQLGPALRGSQICQTSPSVWGPQFSVWGALLGPPGGVFTACGLEKRKKPKNNKKWTKTRRPQG